MNASTAYPALEARFRRMNLVRDAIAMLDWDGAAMMPDGGAEARAEQLAALKLIVHEQAVDPALADLFAAAGEGRDLDEWKSANLREMRRDWLHATALPADLVEARSRAVSACEMRWRTARKENDFAGLLPSMKTVLDLTREVAAIKAARLGRSKYDALLDEYEPGGSSDEIDAIFADLGLAADARAEDIPPDQFVRLERAFALGFSPP